MASRLHIDTSIDDVGFMQGLEKMTNAMNQFVNSVAGGMSKADKAWGAKQATKIEATGKKIEKVTESIRRQEVMVEQLTQKLNAMGAIENTPGSMKTMQREINALEKQLKPMLDEFDRLSNFQSFNISSGKGIDPALDMEIEKVGAKIREAEANVTALKKKLAELRANPQASREGQVLAEKLAMAQQRLDDLRLSARDLDSTMNRLQKQKGPNVGPWTKLHNAMQRIRGEGKKTSGMFAGLGKQTEWFGRQLKRVIWMGLLFTYVRKAMMALTKYIYGALMANSEFAASLASVKGNLLTAFTPIFQAILPALNALMRALAQVTAFIAQFVSLIFGSSIRASQANAKALNDQAKAFGAAGGAAKKAKGELASFDQIEVLNRPDEGGGGGGGGGLVPVFEEQDPAMLSTLEKLNEWLLKIWEVALPLREALGRLWEQLKLLGGFVWQGLVGFYENFLVPVGTWVLGEGLPRFVDSISKLIQDVDWNNIIASLNGLWQALAPFAVHVGAGLLWFWENVIMPISTWVVNDVLPVFLDLIAAAVSALDEILIAAGPAAISFYNDFLVPLGNWIGQAVIDALNWLVQAFRDLSTWISENQELVSTLAEILLYVAAAIVAIWTASQLLKAVQSGITLVSSAIAFMTNPTNLIIAAIIALVAGLIWVVTHWEEVKAWGIAAWEAIVEAWGQVKVWFQEKVIDPLVEFFTNIWNNIAAWGRNSWETLKAIWSIVSTWFNTNIIQPLVTFFTNLWNSVSSVAGDAWAKIKEIWNVVFGWYRDNVINPILGIFGLSWEDIEGFASNAWSKIKGVWDTVSGWFSRNVITPVKNFFSSAWTAIQGFVNDPIGTIKELWGTVSTWFNDSVITPLSKFFEDAWVAIQGFFNDPWGTIQEVWTTVSTWFNDNVITPVQTAFQTAWQLIQGFFNDPWTTIQTVWLSVATWFNDTVIEPLKNFFEPAWTAISGYFDTAWTTIQGVWTSVSTWFQDNVITPIENAFRAVAGVIASVINGAIDIVNWAIGGLEDGLNAVVGAINSVRIKIPGPTVLGKKLWQDIDFGPNVGTVTFGRIEHWNVPGLATGAVIPPNSKFLAMLGDQRSGHNIEAPESLIRQIVREETGGAAGNNFTLAFEGDLAGLARVLRPVLKREGERIGVTIISGGEYAT